MIIGKATHSGLVRSTNEDSIYVHECAANEAYAIVADGMGGHRAGEVASALAVETISSYINAHYKFAMSIDFLRTIIVQSYFEANEAIYQKSAEERYRGMGTTASLCFLTDDTLILSHVGDSRIYTIKNHSIRRLTKDHSLVADLVEKGEITSDEAQVDPRKNVITRAMGTEKLISVDIGTCPYRGEIILVCSDGLTNFVSEEQILDKLEQEEDLQKAADGLIDLANAGGGKDNISVILMKNPGSAQA
jgi:serine/threonine protein phosphatase PrpC